MCIRDSVSTEGPDDSSMQKARDGVKASLLASALAREAILLINQKMGKIHVKRGTRPACGVSAATVGGGLLKPACGRPHSQDVATMGGHLVSCLREAASPR
eukprot:2106446-Amphidinium_carterae.1